MYREKNEFDTIFNSVAVLHGNGVPVAWKDFHSVITPNATIEPLPTYPWQRLAIKFYTFISESNAKQNRQRYWLESDFSYRFRMGLTQLSSSNQSSHPLLPSSFKSSNEDTVHTWHLRVSLDNVQQTTDDSSSPSVLPYLSDHVVHGAVLMPGVAYVEMVRQGFINLIESKMERTPPKSSAVVVKNVRFLRTLGLEPSSMSQIYLRINTQYSSEEWQFEILDKEENASITYATG